MKLVHAAESMTTAAAELVNAMEQVSAVVETNTAAMQEMTAMSTGVSAEIENIANVGHENSAAAKEVSAAATEMTGQIEDIRAAVTSLQEMAHGLQTLVARFTLELAEGDTTAESPLETTTVAETDSGDFTQMMYPN
jgi:methyl-accepting chemotaxis protein